MEIRMIDVSELIPYENNPRNNHNAVESVANSIKQFGFKVPIVITKDNVIVAGHTRLLASQKLGIEKVPCIVADDLSEQQIKAFRLADNKAGELANWDYINLQQELEQLCDDFDMSNFGFDLEDNIPLDLSEFETDVVKEKKEPKKKIVKCPHCNEEFEI